MNRIKHGLFKLNEYSIWCGIKTRCLTKTNKHYKNYGGRGIKVCERWFSSFENFYKDMGPRPSKKHSVERIDNDGNYSPENCQWATSKEQNNNRVRKPILGFISDSDAISGYAGFTA